MKTLKFKFPSKSAAMLFGEHMADTYGVGICVLACPFGAPENRPYDVELDVETGDSWHAHVADIAREAYGATVAA